jgi:hypothetical protein
MALKRPAETSQARGLAGTPSRPMHDGCEEGFVQRFLGEFEVTKQTNECGEYAARVCAVDVVDNRTQAFSADRVLDHKTL